MGDDAVAHASGSGGALLRRLAPAVTPSHGAVYATDCFNVFAALAAGSVDCVFADPPFNLRKDYGRGAMRDDLARRDYLKWSFAWIDECVRLLKPGGTFFVSILPQWDTIWLPTSKSAGCRSVTGSPSR